MERMIAVLRPALAGFAAPALALGLASSTAAPCLAQGLKVDVELVLAVDVSSSMKPSELSLQREGYAAAFRSDEVINTILYGGYGRIAVTYVEWGSSNTHRIIVPWTLVDSAEAARGIAETLETSKIVTLYRTSISGAIRDGIRAFADNAYDGLRRIIDVSGDGPNNEGGLVTDARDKAVAARITINGLPLMFKRRIVTAHLSEMPTLDDYYADCVVGGPSSFVLPVTNWNQFSQAVRRKLALEMSGRDPAVRQAAMRIGPEIRLPGGGGVDCLIGEKYP